ncbi:MAG: L-threonylcarbamoyladenylate synthase [Deltaproteobacteria bacterium]|nr:L-threonylcarbamoyladenylate synthase [Deltaproteobacteria bacterium]
MTRAPEKVKAEDVVAGGAALDRVVEALRRDGLVAYPTETFYGLGANAASPLALDRLYEAKGRPEALPVSVIVADAAALAPLVAEVPISARKLMDAFWPGPLTLVFRAAPGLSDRLTAGTGRIGARVSSHPVAAALAARCGFPITATSANLSGAPEASSAGAIDPALREALDLVVDGGPTPGGPASTILDVTVDPPRVLRAGRVTESEIEAALKQSSRAKE